MNNLKIGKLSHLVHLTPYTLRYYEKIGLLNPKRNSNNQRYYNEIDVKWINFLKRLKKTDMPMKDIIEYSKLRSKGNSTIDQRIELLNSQKQKLVEERNRLNSCISFLNNKLIIYNKIKKEHY